MKKYLIFLLIATLLLSLSGCGAAGEHTPKPEQVQVVNPLMTVASVAEMEEMLDFPVPVLDKQIKSCIVLVIDGYPTNGRIRYADGSDFNITYGSGDVSGIYGGVLEKSVEIQGVTVKIYTYDTLRYAIWETGGFSYSLTGGADLESELGALLAS